jgi:hypothetical protein
VDPLSAINTYEWDPNTFSCIYTGDDQRPYQETQSLGTLGADLPNARIYSNFTATGVGSNHAAFSLSGIAHVFVPMRNNIFCPSYDLGSAMMAAYIFIDLDSTATVHIRGNLTSSRATALGPGTQSSGASFYLVRDTPPSVSYGKGASEGSVENFDDIITLPAGTFRFGLGNSLTPRVSYWPCRYLHHQGSITFAR